MRLRFVAAFRDTFRSLWSRNFRLFFFGQMVSQAGTWMQSIAIVWLVLRLTDDGVALGLTTAAQFLPVLLLGAWGGVLSDRFDRRRILVATQLAYTCVAVAFTVLVFADAASMPWIYLLSTVFGFITAVDNPTRRAFVVDMVAEDETANAVGLNSTFMTASRTVGPAIAGLIITTVGVEWCFVGNAVSYLAVLTALALMDASELRESPRVPRRSGQLGEGLRYVWSAPKLRDTLILTAIVGTLAFEFRVTLPLLAERAFAGGAGTFTALYSLLSAGSVVGGLMAARRKSVDTLYLGRVAAAMGVAMAVLAMAPNVVVAYVTVVPVGLTSVLLIAGSNTLVQLGAEPHMRGRAVALMSVVFLGSTPIGGPVVGAAAEHLGSRVGVGIGAVATVGAAAWILSKRGWIREALAAT